jgi:alpha-beta hydrolase superfamily lysophospholipase
MRAEALEMLIQVNRSRSIAAGLDPFLYDQIVHGVVDFDDWRGRFEATARRFEAQGQEASKKGRNRSAADAYSIATLSLHFATCVPGGERRDIARLLEDAAAAHAHALTASGRGHDRVAGSGDGVSFCGLLERPSTSDPTPAVIVVPGLDSSKEEFDLISEKLRARGVATLRIDGPGQGELLAVSGPTTHYERVVAAAVQALSKLPGIAVDRIGVLGLSLGGYYAPLAAAFEHRLRAVVAVTGPFSFAPWTEMPEMLKTILTLRCDGEDKAAAFVASIDLAHVVRRITQPVLVVAGDADPVVSVEEPRRLAQEAQCAQLLEVASGDHLGANRRWAWEARALDWLAAHLSGT